MDIIINGSMNQGNSQKTNVSALKKFLKERRLSESDEYQMVANLTMAFDDEEEAEKIICYYVRRYGLVSEKAKQVLADFDFKRALKVLKKLERPVEKEQTLDLCSEKISIAQKLRDGFLMRRDD